MALRVQYANKQVFNYTSKELRSLLLTVVIGGFLLSMRRWGGEQLDILVGISNFIIYTLLFCVLYFIFVSAQKWIGSALGYETRYELWKFGPLIAVIISFYLVLIAPDFQFLVLVYLGSVSLKEIPEMRLGNFRRAINVKDMMIVGLAGPIATLVLILIVLQPLFFATNSDIFYVMIIMAALIIFFSSWPFPKMNGINVLIKSRVAWMLYFVFSIAFVLLISLLQVWAYILSVVAAAVIVYWFRVYVAPKFLHNS